MADKITKSKEWMGAFEAFGKAFDAIVKNPRPALFFVGVYTATTVISLILQGKTVYSDPDYVGFADLLILVFIVPLVTYALALADGKSLTVKEFMQINFKHLVVLIVASILAALIILGSLILLIIPAIWTIAWFSMTSFAVIDKDMGPVDALKESKRLVRNHKGKAWAIIGVTILVSIGAGFVALIPYVGVAATMFVSVLSMAASAHLYRWLQTQ